MNAKHFPYIKVWTIPEICFQASLEELAVDGKYGKEGIVLWLGHRLEGSATVTHIVRLRGPGIIKEPDLLQIDASVLNDVTTMALDHNITLVGQIHSHGLYYGVDLSWSDRTYGISIPYYLSLVAPDYGMRQNITLAEYGVHVFEPPEGFRRLSVSEIAERIQVVSSPISVLTVDQEDF